MNLLLVPQHGNQALWPMACWSVLFHLALVALLLNFHISPHFKEAPVYYVDLLTLPVANPQAGTPGPPAQTASPAPPAPASSPREMVLPAKEPAKVPVKPPASNKSPEPEPVQSAREFQERLARLERDNAAKHQAAALERLQQRRASGGPVGMPGATGDQAGSDYSSYIQSRLKEAFKTTIASQTKDPQVIMRITISRTGTITRVKTEKSTGDKLFEDAVARAIAKAAPTIPKPPNGEIFEGGFVFRPEGVKSN